MSYVYDEDGTLIAQTLTGGATTTWGQSARYIYLPTASGPMPVAAIYGTKHYAIQSDHLNTPRRLIQSDGQVAWQWAYSAFGDEKPTTAKTRFANAELNQSFGTTTVPAVTFNLRYPGQYFDQESNLHYNLNRSYCPGCGRYTQSDPIDLQGGWNRFSYVGQNPLSFTDPTGQYAQALAVCAMWPAGTALCGASAVAVGWGMFSTPKRPTVTSATQSSPATVVDLCPQCKATMSREMAQALAYAHAGIPNGGGPNFTPLPWKPNFNPPNGVGFGSRPWANFQQTYYPPNFGWYGSAGRVEEHPFGHPDLPGGKNHECPHFVATNASGITVEFPYRPGS